MVLLVLVLPTITSGPLASIPVVESNLTTSDLLLEQMIPDTNITSPPEVVINGSSEEFSSSHHASTGPDDPSYINLTWTHVANTTLDFRNESAENYPDCNDFIYFYQEMSWDHEQMPEDAMYKVEYRIVLNETFEEEAVSSIMGDIYVWLVDSSENWWEIGRRSIESTIEYSSFMVNLHYFDLLEGWQGMVEEEGYQDDPEDVLNFVVGLSPSFYFQSYQSTEPWRIYNGSVTLSVRYMILEAVLGTTPFEHGSLESVVESTWSNPRSIWFSDYAVSDDGTSFSVGRISSYEDQVAMQMLVKWDPLGMPLWGKTWSGDYRSVPGAVATHEGYVITAANGYREDSDPDILLTKWNSSGHRMWYKYIDLGGREYPSEMTIGSDGSIYIVGDRMWNESDTWHYDSFMVKLDSNGEVLWSNIHEDLGAGNYQVEVDENGTIYAMHIAYAGISAWNSSGGLIWQNGLFAEDFCLGPNGDIYVISSTNLWFRVSRMNNTGGIAWEKQIEIRYTDLWYEWLTADSLSVDENGDVYVIVAYYVFQFEWVLHKFAPNGNAEWNRTILSPNWFNLWSGSAGRTGSSFAPNGLLYVGGMLVYDDGSTPSSLSLAILNPNNVPLPTMTTTTTSTTSTTTTTDEVDFDIMFLVIGSGIAIVIIVIIIVFRKMKHSSTVK
jgi:hypothetical protein